MQLTIYDDMVFEKAEQLLIMLNESLPAKEQYVRHFWFEHDGLFVFMAANSDKKAVFNVLTEYGETPTGFGLCWRDWPSLKHDIQNLNK